MSLGNYTENIDFSIIEVSSMDIKNKLIPLADPKKQNFDVKLHSFLITRIGSNPRPLKRKSPLIITRPGLPPLVD